MYLYSLFNFFGEHLLNINFKCFTKIMSSNVFNLNKVVQLTLILRSVSKMQQLKIACKSPVSSSDIIMPLY